METATYPSAQDTPRTPGDVVTRGKAIYERDIRPQLETPENIGKALVIDIDTGDYLIGDDVNAEDDYEVALKAADLFSDHARFGMRIGYNVVDVARKAIHRLWTFGHCQV